MSIFRVMMLFYIIQNFERIVFSILFLLFFTYFFSYSAVLYHDGISSFLLYKNPIFLFRRVFHIVKWYYYNRDALSAGRISILSIIFFATFFIQSVVCRIPWRSFYLSLFQGIIKRCGFTFSNFQRRGSVRLPSSIEKEKEKFLINVERIADNIVYDFMKMHRSRQGVTDANISRVRDVATIKIGHEIEDLVRSVLVKIDLLHDLHDSSEMRE